MTNQRVVNIAVLRALQQLGSRSSIIESICTWNKLRYPQMLDTALTVKLLVEEVTEIGEAIIENNLVEILDGHADVFYVAIGALWKAGLAPNHILELMDAVEKDTQHMPPLPVCIQWWEMETHMGDAAPWLLAITALVALDGLEVHLGNVDAAMDVIRAVCVSNNTKEVVMTEPGVKANINKGPNYVPPTEMIQSIIDNLNRRIITP